VRNGEAAPCAAAAQPHLQDPIGVSQRLARRADDISLTATQNILGLFEVGDTAGSNNRRFVSRRIDRALDRRGQRYVAAKGTDLVRQDRGHALVAALAGIRVDGLAHLGLLRVLELPTL